MFFSLTRQLLRCRRRASRPRRRSTRRSHPPVRKTPQYLPPADEVPVGEVAAADPLPTRRAQVGCEQGVGEQRVDGGREAGEVGRIVDEPA